MSKYREAGGTPPEHPEIPRLGESETTPCLEPALPHNPCPPPLDTQQSARFSFPTGPTSQAEDTELIQIAQTRQATQGSHSFPSRKKKKKKKTL